MNINNLQTMSDAIMICSAIIFIAFLCITFALISISSSMKKISDTLEEKLTKKVENKIDEKNE